ncbi:MAG: hypothetical protein ACRCXZ_01825 [Patescibacteria group bacterium]
MKVQTRIIGPDLSELKRTRFFLDVLSREFKKEYCYFEDSDYLELLIEAKSDPLLKRFLDSCHHREPTLVNLEGIFVETDSSYLLTDQVEILHTYTVGNNYQSPLSNSIELSVQMTEDKEKKMYIDFFIPGFLQTGQGGVGGPLLNEVIELAKYHRCSSVYCLALEESLGFWEKMGFTEKIMIGNQFGEYYSSKSLN